MYNQYTLSLFLKQVGFSQIKSAFEISIPEWQSFELGIKNCIFFTIFLTRLLVS